MTRRGRTQIVVMKKNVVMKKKEPGYRLARQAASRIKAFVGWLLFRSGIYRLVWRGQAVIVVFHRVNDSYPDDPLTCTTAEFERFTRFFARFFEVIPLGELLRRLRDGSSLDGSLTVTFDDGYRGNATAAAPILEQHGLRGCFFVTTGFIGTDHVPWWDKEMKIQTKWMSWDQLRALRETGHEIGSHTETHVDLGTVSRDEAKREIKGGEDHLVRELGAASGFFAYPYGRRRNMSDENRTLPEELGLKCCLSARGGSVRAGDDPYHLKRVNISGWFASPYQFGFELIAGRLEEE
jgi:peptidoglycan/xylan/chitin deacetylase (PgdA/CDA1 family)